MADSGDPALTERSLGAERSTMSLKALVLDTGKLASPRESIDFGMRLILLRCRLKMGGS